MISYVEAGPGDRGSGGGFYNHGQATLRETAVLGNRLLGGIVGYFYRLAHGGGIYNAAAGRLEIDSCRLNGNFASGLGGGLANYGSLTLTGGEISQNNALDSGGGLFNLGSLVLSQALIYENFTGPGYPGLQRVYRYHSDPPTNGWSPSGGGIFNAGIARFDAIQVINNRAGDGGHGGNSGDYYPAADGGAGGSGGGIANSGVLEINYSVVQGNQAGRGGERGYNYSTWGDGLDGSGGGGGGIFNWGKLTGAFVDLRENLAGAGFSETEPGGDGGGLASLAGQGEFQWRDSRVSGNATQAGGKGGGLFLDGVSDPNGKYVLTNSQVISNTAGADGGGLYLTHSDIEVANLVIAANQAGAGFSGSGIFLADHNLAAAGLTIAANIGGDGSGVRLAAGTMALNNTIVAGQQVGVSLAEGTTARLTATLWGAGGWANGVDWAGSGELIPGMDDFSADPRFLAPQAGDFHLSADSPAIDVGTSAGPAFDLDNQSRRGPLDGQPDRGADEFWLLVSLSTATIAGPAVATAEQPVAFTAVISPADATPNISYFWQPSPAAGQWTAAPTFVFPAEGVYRLQVTALNAGAPASGEFSVSVLPNVRYFYLPLVAKR